MTEADPFLARRSQNNILGLWLMVGGFALFSAGDAVAKLLTESYHPVQIAWTRQLGLIIGILILLALRGRALLHSETPWLQASRGVMAALSATCFIFAVAHVPLADAVAVSFVAPFMVTVLGALLLGEPVGIRRWAAVAVGFVGMLIVVRPGAGVFHPAILLVVLAASAFAGRQIISRRLGSRDRTETTLAYTALTAAALLTVPLPFVWRTPLAAGDLALMAGLALLAGCGEFLVIRALEIAQAVVVAPTHYSLILFGTFWGFVIFGQLPDLWTGVGALVISASGLYTIYRESRKSPPPPPAAASGGRV